MAYRQLAADPVIGTRYSGASTVFMITVNAEPGGLSWASTSTSAPREADPFGLTTQSASSSTRIRDQPNNSPDRAWPKGSPKIETDRTY